MYGSGFDATAQVLWNGISLSISSRSSGHLSANVPPSFLASPTTANITVRNSDGSTSNAVTFVVAAPTSITTPPTLPQATVGTYYSMVLTASGGVHQFLTEVHFWTLVSGALPPGMNLSLYGAFYGTPQSPGVFRFTLQAADNFEYSKSTREFTLVVSGGLTISPGTLPPGNVDSVYSQKLAATGGTGPYSWSLASGTLPQGLLLSQAGQITGTPTAIGTSSFTVKVVDTTSKSGTAVFSLAISAPLGPVFIGSTPHIAAQSDWVTTFTLVNKGTKTAQTQTKFFGDSSAPGGGGPLTLPLVFPQQAASLSAASLDQNISANASLIVQTAGSRDSPLIGDPVFLDTD